MGGGPGFTSGIPGGSRGFAAVEFHHVRSPYQTQPQRVERQAADAAHSAARLDSRASLIGAAVQVGPLYGQRVVGPLLLDMDQDRLTLTEDQMLERGEGEETLLVEHPAPPHNRS
jgi:hypothetical protein